MREGLLVNLKQVGGTKNGFVFWDFLRKNIKIISSPPVPASVAHSLSAPVVLDPDFELGPDEEFVVVNAKAPDHVLRTTSTITTAHAKDVKVGACIFNPLVGQRKRLKNKAAVYGFFNSITGALGIAVNHHYDCQVPIQERYNLIGIAQAPDWAPGWNSSFTMGDAQNLELRKYNTVTRSINILPVSFDIEAYMRRYVQRMMVTTVYGEAVGKVCSMMAEEGVIYPYLITASYDANDVKYQQDLYNIPKDKDIFLEAAFKTSLLKKKDMLVVNNNGFVAVACKTEAERDALAAHYSNKEKQVKLIEVKDLTQDVRIDLNELGPVFVTVNVTPQWTMSPRMKKATP